MNAGRRKDKRDKGTGRAAKAAAPPRAADTPRTPASGLSMAAALFSGPALWMSVAMIVACVAVYTPVWQYDFVAWDDPMYGGATHVMNGLRPESIRWAFTVSEAGLWIPVTFLSLMLDVAVFGPGAGGHHLVNLLLHIANTLLLFGLLRRMTGSLGRSAFVAALFALHPLHVESVAWVTERKDVLSAFFGFLMLWAYLAYVRRPEPLRYVWVVLLFAVALMAKPMVVTFPFALLLLDIWPLRRVELGAESERNFGWGALWDQHAVLWRLIREKIPLFAVTILSSVITVFAQVQEGAVSALEAKPLGTRIENALVSYAAYIGKALWPSKLSGLYPYHEPAAPLVIVSAALVIAITVWALRESRRPYLAVGWLWFLGTLVPVIGLVQVGIQARADRFTYIPLIGLSIMAAWGIAELAARWRREGVALAGASMLVLTALAVVSWAQVRHWKDSLTFWQHNVDVTFENGRAHGNLGLVLSEQGRDDEAIAQYREAIRILPELGDVHNNLANLLSKRRQSEEAIAHYLEAIKYEPDNIEAHNGIGSLLDDLGRYEEAVGHYREALRLEPTSARVHNNLAVSLLNLGRNDEAVAELLEATRLAPEEVDFQLNAAVILEQLGRGAEARPHLEAVLRLDPGKVEARRQLDALGDGEDPTPR